MFEPRGATAPFPGMPGAASKPWRLRAFGQSERDLEVDFTRPLPYLVTEILGACTEAAEGERVAEDFFWDLSVGKRVECLLVIASLSGGRPFEWRFACRNPACRLDLELELTLDDIAALQARADAEARFTVPVEAGGAALVLRRPTGRDQRTWLAAGLVDEAEARKAMLEDLCVEGSPSAWRAPPEPGWMEAVERALDEHDPLVNLSVGAICPDCGAENAQPAELQSLALERLQEARRGLLRAVHRLAGHYHWSERDIFAVPAWRRAYYLALIARDEDR